MGKFTKNTLITIGANLLQLILALGSSIIIARVLGPEGKGVYSLAILLPSLLITFAQFGIGPASVFTLGKNEHSPKQVFGANIFLAILISILSIVAGLIVIFFLNNQIFPGIEKEYLFLALSLVPVQIFFSFCINILLGLQKIKKYNFIQLIKTFTFLILIVIFLLGLRFGIKTAIVIELISSLIASAILFSQTKKETRGITILPNKKLLKDIFSYGSKSYLGNVATFLYLRIDIWMINIFLNPAAVGFYSISVGLAEKIWLISKSAGTVLFPRVSSEKNEETLKKFTPLVCRNILFITTLIAIALFFIGKTIIILLYSTVFLNAIQSFKILLIGTIAVAGSRILTNDLAGRGKPMVNTYLAIITAALNILLNIILIPRFGISGAAWATAISYTLIFIVKTIVYSKISGNKIKDIIFIKNSDLRLYRNILISIKNKILHLATFEHLLKSLKK